MHIRADKWVSLQDSNLGLVKQVLSSLYKRNIQRLTQTYLTLSLQDIANTVQLETAKQAELHVLQMVVSILCGLFLFVKHVSRFSKFQFSGLRNYPKFVIVLILFIIEVILQ